MDVWPLKREDGERRQRDGKGQELCSRWAGISPSAVGGELINLSNQWLEPCHWEHFVSPRSRSRRRRSSTRSSRSSAPFQPSPSVAHYHGCHSQPPHPLSHLAVYQSDKTLIHSAASSLPALRRSRPLAKPTQMAGRTTHKKLNICEEAPACHAHSGVKPP